MHWLKTILFLSMAFLVTLSLLCVEASSNVTMENLNALIISNMQHQMKTMEESLKLVQMSCGRQVTRVPSIPRDPVIAFHAKLEKTIQNVAKDAKLVMDDVRLNEGAAYNGNTGAFTCPTDGVYVFEWTILSNPGKYFHLDFMINGKMAVKTYNDQLREKANSVTGNVVVKMKKGDLAWLEPHASSTGQHAYDEWTSFSGFKL